MNLRQLLPIRFSCDLTLTGDGLGTDLGQILHDGPWLHFSISPEADRVANWWYFIEARSRKETQFHAKMPVLQ